MAVMYRLSQAGNYSEDHANWRTGELANSRSELANWRTGELANWRVPPGVGKTIRIPVPGHACGEAVLPPYETGE